MKRKLDIDVLQRPRKQHSAVQQMLNAICGLSVPVMGSIDISIHMLHYMKALKKYRETLRKYWKKMKTSQKF